MSANVPALYVLAEAVAGSLAVLASRHPSCALSERATAGTERAHSVGCGVLQRATETARRQRFRADSASRRGPFPPYRRERMSDDAKFILGIG
jgi:hypothetical protein